MFEKQEFIGDLIQSRVHLGRVSATGFHSVKCQLCGDHSERAGWKIEPHEIFYNCYNCGFHASYEEGSGKFSRWFKELCRANGIQDTDLQGVAATLFFNKGEVTEKELTLESLKKVKLHTPEIAFPDRCFPLGSAGHDAFQEPLIEYLLDRQVDPLKFYFSLDPKMLRRVVIPFWRDSKLIYWQARAIDGDVKPRYKNSAAAKDAIIYGYDKLYSYDDGPLFVTEGVFDAESIEGISILGSKLNAAKIEVLKRTKRRIIFVLDRDSNGGDLGYDVLDNGWEITHVDVRAEDINDSVCKFGSIFTMYSLLKNATNKNDRRIDSPLSIELGMMEARMRKSKYE